MNISIANIFNVIFLTECVNTIINEYIIQNEYVNVVNGKNSYNFVTVQTNYEENTEYIFTQSKPAFYVVEEGNQRLFETVKILINNSNYDFNPRANFFFIASNFSKEFIDLISFHFIINALLFNIENWEISTFTWKQSNEINEKLKNLGSCRNIVSKETQISLPSKSIHVNWKGSSVNILYHKNFMVTNCINCKFRGIEIEIYEMLFQNLKIKTNFQLSENYILENFEFYSVYDVFIGGFSYSLRDFFLDITLSYIQDEIALFVPKDSTLPRWKYIIRIFSITSWIFWTVSLVIMGIVGVLLSSTVLQLRRKVMLKYIVLGVLKLILEQNHCFRTEVFHIRIFNILMLFFGLTCNILIKTGVTHYTNAQLMDSPINSIEDIIKSNLDVAVPYDGEIFLHDAQLLEYLKYHRVSCDFSITSLLQTAYQRDLISYRGVMKARFEKRLIDQTTGEWLLKQLPQQKAAFPLYGFFKRGHPLFYRFNYKLRNLIESGIVSKISSKYDIIREQKIIFMKIQILGLKDLIVPSYLLLIGLFTSCIVFTTELWSRKPNLDADETL